MEILISKLREHKLLEGLITQLSEYKRKKILREELIPLYEIVKVVDLETIDYTFNDCLSDYKDKLKNQAEKYVIWKIWKKGYSTNSFQVKHNISNVFQRMLREGVDYNSEFRGDNYLIDLLELDIDLSSFKVHLYDSHMEIFGNEQLLIELRDKFKLSYDVIWENKEKSFHLAFTGILANYIRKDQKPK